MADETWITTVYRRTFGSSAAFGSDSAAQLFDRAAQLILDRENEAQVRALIDMIAVPEEGLSAGPLTTNTVNAWRKWVVDFLLGERPYSWERLRHMADRISRRDPDHPVHALADRFISDVPAGLELLYERMPRAELDSYVMAAMREVTGAVAHYMNRTADTAAAAEARRTEAAL